MMRNAVAALLLAIPVLAAPAAAALKEGTNAADFTTQGALAGKVMTINLKKALKKGPVVLYFFPAAFTPGCSAEARAFAASIDAFAKQGATVIGMSADPIDKLADFSTKDCASKFTVARADPAVIRAYDVAREFTDGNGSTRLYTDRTSYVIGTDGRVIYSYSDPSAAQHVKNTLAAVQAYKAKHP